MAKCPRCNTEITNSVCPECGWLEITFPKFPKGSNLPQEISDAIERSREVYNQKKQEKEALQKEIEELKANQNAAAVTNTETIMPVGIVSITNKLSNNYQAVAPIYPGLNTYGSDESDGSHHKVYIGIRGKRLAPKHFSIETRERGFLLKDLTGNEMNLPEPSMYVDGKTIFIDNNNIEIKFLKFF